MRNQGAGGDKSWVFGEQPACDPGSCIQPGARLTKYVSGSEGACDRGRLDLRFVSCFGNCDRRATDCRRRAHGMVGKEVEWEQARGCSRYLWIALLGILGVVAGIRRRTWLLGLYTKSGSWTSIGPHAVRPNLMSQIA